MNELIEKLKDKNYVRAFGLMSPEEQGLYRKVKSQNCIRFWIDRWTQAEGSSFNPSLTYTIKPDYSPEPEFVDLEIVTNDKWLGVWKKTEAAKYAFLPFQFTPLNCLPGLPNFAGFWCGKPSDQTTYLGNVAERICEVKKVYARFRA